MNPFITYVTTYRIVVSLHLSFRRFHAETSSYKLYVTWPNSEISRTLPRNAFLLKITTQQQKCINLNIEHLRLKFLIINLTKNNKAPVTTNITKVGSITSIFIVVAQSRKKRIVVKSFIHIYRIRAGQTYTVLPKSITEHIVF